jgi:undecaprenyl diphosphate synthase
MKSYRAVNCEPRAGLTALRVGETDAAAATSPPATVSFARRPRHVGFIPDGNRRWAVARKKPKGAGYAAGIAPGIVLLHQCRSLGIAEVSVYGFTKENVHRPADQVRAFREACEAFAEEAVAAGAGLCVIGDTASSAFPSSLRKYAATRAPGDIRVNLLVNYGWQWDLAAAGSDGALASAAASRIDLVVRWGGRRRLSGFLPVQCAYADIYVLDTLWPDMAPGDFIEALRWYERQDVTRGG